jgi:hypothetical protein
MMMKATAKVMTKRERGRVAREAVMRRRRGRGRREGTSWLGVFL